MRISLYNEAMNLTFLTYNVLYNRGYLVLKEYIKKHEPDIICLQEVETDEGNLRLLQKLDYKLADYSNSFIKFGKIYGVATFYKNTRLKFVESNVIDLPKTIYDVLLFLLRGGNRPRTVLCTQFHLKSSKKIMVYNMHLSPIAGNGARLRQIKETLENLDVYGLKNDTAVIITGDLNFYPWGRKRLEKLINEYNLKEATKNIAYTIQYSEDGKLENYNLIQRFGIRLMKTAFSNKLKVDYVFYKNLDLVSATRLDTRHSDHFPVVSQFRIK